MGIKLEKVRYKSYSQVPLSTQMGRELRKLMIHSGAGWSLASLPLPWLSMSAAMELCSPYISLYMLPPDTSLP